MGNQIMHAAMTKFSLIQGSSPSRTLLQDLADVTGIPVTDLLLAEHRMVLAGGLAPLRELLANPTVPKAERLKYKLGIKRLQKMPSRTRRIDVCRLILDVESVQGRLQISVDMVLREREATAVRQDPAGAANKQTAKLSICYRLLRGAIRKTFRHAMTVSAYSPETPPRTPRTRGPLLAA